MKNAKVWNIAVKNANFLKHINAEVFILQLCVFLIDLKLFFFS